MNNDIFKYFPESPEDTQCLSTKIYEYTVKKFLTEENIKQFGAFILDEADFLNEVPEFKSWLDKWQLSSVGKKTYAILCVPEKSRSGFIHCDCDEPNKYAQIVWPVNNCAGSVTKIFDFPAEYEWIKLDYGSKETTYFAPNPPVSDYKELARYELLKPLVWYPYIPHGLYPNHDLVGPRLSLTIAVQDANIDFLFNDSRLKSSLD